MTDTEPLEVTYEAIPTSHPDIHAWMPTPAFQKGWDQHTKLRWKAGLVNYLTRIRIRVHPQGFGRYIAESGERLEVQRRTFREMNSFLDGVILGHDMILGRRALPGLDDEEETA